jgi:YidC/Oxa1 family membrane protein insertase
MKKVMPQVNELKEKYGDDKEKMQQEMLKLYQHEGVNPAAGCFPIILQIPIFFALYKILFISIELRHQPFYGWIQDLSAADPTNVFNAFGLIPWDPPSFLHVGIWPCFMLVAMQIQRSLSPPPTDTLQRDMMRFFPIVMTFIMAKFASGLVIYWTISAFFGNLQQIIIMRKMGVPIHLFGESHDDEDKAKEAKAEITEKPAKKAEYEAIKDISPPKPKRKKKK